MSQDFISPNDDKALSLPGQSSRRSFLHRSAIIAVAGGTAAAVIVATNGTARGNDDNRRQGNNDQRGYFKQIRGHENDHVEFLVTALGSAARPKPHFKGLEQHSYADFVKVSQALENTGVGAYLGAAPAIDSAEYLAAAGSIFAIEARHAGWLNTLRDDPITGNLEDDDSNNSFEAALDPSEVVAAAGPFIKDLNGGPAVTYSMVPSASNDIAILNFALALEYLEAEFYNINVKKFFGK